ncbi:MAG: TlpA family protein disulfide reductase [Gemmatimonadetes bacterium]|nr:TlpA family protein disulfide reductase [Gemmatimonadota bacterium]
MKHHVRPVLAIVLAGLAGGVWWLADRRPTPIARGPITVPHAAAAPDISVVGSVRHVHSEGAAERLLVDSMFPDGPVQLLWFEGRPAQPTTNGAVTMDGSGGVLRFDRTLRPAWLHFEVEGRELTAAAPARDGGSWLAATSGDILHVDRLGRMTQFAADSAGHFSTTAHVPIQFPGLAADPNGHGVWITRSPDRFGFGWHPAGTPPAILLLGEDGRIVDSVGAAVVPAHVLLADLANAGRVAVSGDTVWYAPFIRDQVIAFGPHGDTLWVATRGLGYGTTEPRFEVAGGKPVIDYLPVNLGIALGPDGRVYVLSTRDSSTTLGRLDAFNRVTGVLERSAELSTPTPTLAADGDGRIYLLNASRLLTGVAPRERVELAAFDLDRLGGGRLSSADLRGKVALVNFWASWCGPCRTEMPALDSLRRGITDPEFVFIAIDEDVKVEDGKAFIGEFGFDFPVLFGRGRMKERYHYLGLPFTVLLDRNGEVAGQWLGYAGPGQIGAIRAIILNELARSPRQP